VRHTEVYTARRVKQCPKFSRLADVVGLGLDHTLRSFAPLRGKVLLPRWLLAWRHDLVETLAALPLTVMQPP
jgi:hypothetical protein